MKSFKGSLLLASVLLLNACGGGEVESKDSHLDGYYDRSRVWTKSMINVCFEASGDESSSDRTRVRNLIESTWQRYATVSFHGWGTCTSSSTDIRIFMDSEIKRGRSGIGTDIATQKKIWDFDGNLRDGNMLLPTDGGTSWVNNTIIHEFGHALGIMHEHARDDSLCSEGESDDRWVKHGSYDAYSVMNYCRLSTSLSTGDISLISALYGARRSISHLPKRSYQVKISGKCLDVQWGSHEMKTPLWQWPCTGNNAQLFAELPYSGEYFMLVNERSGRCVDVQWGSVDKKAPIWQWNCTGNSAQLFRKVWVDNTYFMIQNLRSGRCIDVQWGSQDDKTPFWQWDCTQNAAQLFRYR